MKISLKWLNSYVDVSDYFTKPEELAEKIIHAGLEVEGIENQKQQFQNVVIGHVLEKGQHPDADRLSLCQVDVGGKTQQIVCGATNHQQGDKVVAALPGAVLPGDFAIKKSKIRGVESLGMLCSETELGLGSESDGILILPADAPTGTSFAEYHGLDDIVLELSVTPNRADCLSHWGLAREVSCLLDRPLKKPEATMSVSSEKTSDQMKLSVANSELCPRYAGRSIQGVTIKESPAWLKQRLEAIGVNSINNVVDVTNFIMMELGQPLHSFDADQVAGREIRVDLAKSGEKFITLDGTEIELKGDELTIRDAEKPVALAGIVGGVNSGVTDSTKELFIEAAYFTMATVRKTARKFGIETDSAYRFSRGVDPDGVAFAMDRACKLIQEVAGGEILDAAYDNYPNPISKDPISVSREFISQKLGYEISAEDFEMWMKRLGCEVENLGADQYSVKAPVYRWDISIREDLVEEFARLNGYDKIPETMPALATEPTLHVDEYLRFKEVNSQVVAQGFQQAVNHSFLDSVYQDEFLGDVTKLAGLGLETDNEAVSLRNPLSEELGVMRKSLLPGLIRNATYNERHGNLSGKLFETGFVFGHEGEDYWQKPRLALVSWGVDEGLWNKDKTPLIFKLKSDVERVLGSLKSKSWRWDALGAEKAPDFLHPGQSAALFFEGKVIGFVGALHPKWKSKLKVRHDLCVAEFDFALLTRGQPRKVKAATPSKFPKVERDLAFLMPKSLSAGAVMGEIKKAAGKNLVGLSVFDVYEGENLQPDERSVAFRLHYQGLKETMTDDQILGLQEKVINSVSQKFSISVR